MSNDPTHDVDDPTITHDPEGAIDRDFDDAERDARDQITDRLAEHNRTVEARDVAIDLVYHRPVFVRRSVADSCVAYWEDGRDFDLTTYKAHPYLPVTPDDTVFECVYIPTKPGDVRHDPADKTYDFPAGRLMRVPVEYLYDSKTRPQDDFRAAFLAALLATADDVGIDGSVEMIHASARAAFGEDVAFDAAKRAGIPARDGGKDAELGDFDGGEA